MDPAEDRHLDYARVRAYWEEAAREPDAASYMAHEQGLPPACVEHRFALERAVVDLWFADLGPRSAVLDAGCGAGAWTELFAQRYRRVVGVDASAGMLAAAANRLKGRTNVELHRADALTVTLDGPFDGVLLGGLMMYLDRPDAVALLMRLAELAPHGRIILRESGVRSGVEHHTGAYQVAYRSVIEYRSMAAEAHLRVVAVERNRGYADMEIAVALVDLVRRLPLLARRDPALVGGPLWRVLQATAPLSLGALPRAIEAVGAAWPHLTNHFILLEPTDARGSASLGPVQWAGETSTACLTRATSDGTRSLP
ncbi:MAG: class I SAM-dependent methyltransferase [Acidimicrobiales bacterium]